jgi:hypothetical protein
MGSGEGHKEGQVGIYSRLKQAGYILQKEAMLGLHPGIFSHVLNFWVHVQPNQFTF